jgi:hypothetical protein
MKNDEQDMTLGQCEKKQKQKRHIFEEMMKLKQLA